MGKMDDAPTPGYLRALSKCLLCGACENKCANNVPVTELIRMARSHHRQSLLKNILQQSLMPHSKRLQLAFKVGKPALDLLSKRILPDSGLMLRLGLDRHVPKPPTRDLFTELGTDKKRSDTAVFAGCVAGYLKPNIGHATFAALQSLGIHADLPNQQACCGLMAFGAGDAAGSKKAADSFVRTFGRYERIVVPCASCFTMLSKHLPAVNPQAENLARRVVEIHTFLEEQDFSPKPLSEPDTIAYHSPCHFRFETPHRTALDLLHKTPGATIVEPVENCCGFGGGFTLANPELSQKIGAKRATMILETGARIVATPCSGCILGLYDSLGRLPAKIKVVHPIELLCPPAPD